MRLGSAMRRRRSSSSGNKKSATDAGGRWSAGGGELLRNVWVAVGLGLGGLLLGWLFATQVLFPAAAPPGDLREVPSLAGLTEAEASERVAAAGLVLGEAFRIRHPEVDSGRVLGQSPLAGQLALVEGSVSLAVSLGPELRRVPEVLRLRGNRATALLEATGFEVRVDSAESELPRGRVLDVSPTPGTPLPLPGTVEVVVSTGPRIVAVPELLGMEEQAARDTLVALGLTVSEVEEVFRFGRDQGRVVGQEPAEGTELERGTAVRLVVGRRGGIPQDR